MGGAVLLRVGEGLGHTEVLGVEEGVAVELRVVHVVEVKVREAEVHGHGEGVKVEEWEEVWVLEEEREGEVEGVEERVVRGLVTLAHEDTVKVYWVEALEDRVFTGLWQAVGEREMEGEPVDVEDVVALPVGEEERQREVVTEGEEVTLVVLVPVEDTVEVMEGVEVLQEVEERDGEEEVEGHCVIEREFEKVGDTVDVVEGQREEDAVGVSVEEDVSVLVKLDVLHAVEDREGEGLGEALPELDRGAETVKLVDTVEMEEGDTDGEGEKEESPVVEVDTVGVRLPVEDTEGECVVEVLTVDVDDRERVAQGVLLREGVDVADEQMEIVEDG